MVGWVQMVSSLNLRSYFLIPIFGLALLLTANSPPMLPRWPPKSTKYSPVSPNALISWFLVPITLCLAILAWLHTIEQLNLPSWVLVPLQLPVLSVLIGGSLYTLYYWFDRFLECILDSHHFGHCQRLSLVPDLYEGIWLTQVRRKRRNSGPGPRFCVRYGPSFPSISFTVREAATIVLLLLAWLFASELPSRDPLAPPAPTKEYKAAANLRDSVRAGESPSRSTPSTRHSYDYWLLHHHLDKAFHYLLVKPCHLLFDFDTSTNPLSPPPWPAPSLDFLTGSGFDRSPPLCYSDDTNQFDVGCVPDDDGLPEFFSSVITAADQHTVNLLHFTDDVLSLHDADYSFTFDFLCTSEVYYSPDLPQYWTDFHSKMKELELKAAPVPSWSTMASEFLSTFSPAEAASTAFGHWMYSFSRGFVSVDLSRRFARVHPTYLFNVKMKHVPLIVDSGASVCITPELSDFKHGSYKRSNMKVRDLSGENKVLGEGLVHWAVKDIHGNTHVIEIFALHIPHAGVRLLSPQVLKRTHNIGGSMEDDGIHLSSPNVSILAPYSSISNLPELELVDMPKTSSIWSDTFANISSAHTHNTNVQQVHLSVTDPGNTNLSPSQKELLSWHQRLSHTNLSKVRLMCKRKQWIRVATELANELSAPAILPCKHDATSRCNSKDIKCAACCMAKQTLRSHKTPRPTTPNEEMRLKANDTTPGACISCDHYVSPLRGRLVTGYGTKTSTEGYTGGAIYVDHASGKIFHYPQVSLDSESTVRGKQMLEAEAALVDVKVKK
jgi:hypothetical protein